jgi:hypothetical protein
MGGDGGSIPTRIDMVKVKGYGSAQRAGQGSMGFSSKGMRRIAEDSVDPREKRRLRMTRCALTENELRKPIVVDRCGNLFNKDEVIKRLLAKTLPNDLYPHITGLGDVLEVSMSDNSPTCPITGRSLADGVTKSEAFWPCGCVISEKGITTVSLDREKCTSCERPVVLRTKICPDSEKDIASQKECAWEMRSKKKSSKQKDLPSHGTVLSSKRFKPTGEGEQAVKELKSKSEVMSKILRS